MESKNNIDIIIPVYNSEKYVSTCIESLLAQKYKKKYNIIIVDNSSSDNTVSIINKYIENNRNIVLYTEKKRGSYAARNKGILESNAEYLLFIDADCIADYCLLLTYDKIIHGSQSNIVVSGDIKLLRAKYTAFGAFDSIVYLNQELSSKRGIAATANLLVSKQIIDKYGAFDSQLKSAGDVEFTKRLKDHDVSLHFEKNAVVYHPIRLTFKENLKKSIRVGVGNGQMHKKNKEYYKILKPNLLIIIIKYLFKNNYVEAFEKKIGCFRKFQLFFVAIILQFFNYTGKVYGLIITK